MSATRAVEQRCPGRDGTTGFLRPGEGVLPDSQVAEVHVVIRVEVESAGGGPVGDRLLRRPSHPQSEGVPIVSVDVAIAVAVKHETAILFRRDVSRLLP